MKQTVKLVIVFLIPFLINGCSYSLFTCVTPDVKEPVLDNSRKSNVLQSSKQCVRNYLLMKQYAEELKEANEVCK